MQGHEKALEKLPSKVAAMVPKEQYVEAMEAAGLRASNSRFINFAELASIEALQVMNPLPMSAISCCNKVPYRVMFGVLVVKRYNCAGCRVGACQRSGTQSHRCRHWIRAELHNRSGRGGRLCVTGPHSQVS